MGKTKIRRIIIFSALAAALGLAIIFARGPHVSNFLKKLVLPELCVATGRQVVAQKIYVNLFPLFVEAREIKVFDGGNEILRIPRLKGYLDLVGFLRKKVVVRRLVVKEPDVRTDAAQLEDISRNIRKYLQIERETPFKAVIKAVVLDNGKFTFGYKESTFQGSGFSGEAVLSSGENSIARKRLAPKISFTLKELASSVKGWPA
ncbi:MAG TPA: hypothetical protein VN328_01530, partial [Thermodesulfovibrionales bacterium]|nr:hypothetical protein [Thermodesulfovibrionales bacterium]